MTTITSYRRPMRATGFEALLISVGTYLIAAGERRAAEQQRCAKIFAARDEQVRDYAAARHSGLWR